MNILHINSEATWRGGEQQLAYLIDGQLTVNNLNITIMGKQGSALETWCQSKNIPFIPAPFRGSADMKTTLKIAQFCKQHDVDIIHAHTSHAHAAALYSKALNNPAQIVLHRRVAFPVKNNFLSQWKYRSTHLKHIICISQCVQDVLQQSTSNSSRSSVIFDAISLDRFTSIQKHNVPFRERYHLPEKAQIVSNISALTSEKDHYTFIDTAKKVLANRSDLIFLIAGDGKERSNIEQYIADHGLCSKVFLLGFVEDVKEVFDNTDLFLITSKQEGLGTTILDAFANEVAVVATAAGGIPEIVKHRSTGLLCEIGDSDDLAKHVELAFSDAELREELISNAKGRVLKDFLVPTMVEKTLAVYHKILGA